jgi:hypothetical protein
VVVAVCKQTAGSPGSGATGAGNGAGNDDNGSAATMYGAGGGGSGGEFVGATGGVGFQGIVIIKYVTGAASASGGQETVIIPL